MNSTDAAGAEEMAGQDKHGKGLEQVSAEAQWDIGLLKNVRIAIAVIGVSGAGKSSFVNALQGLDDDEERSAKTEVPTIEPTPFPYPPIPNFFIWDLPGFGTSEFEAHKYLKQVNSDRYDFFILVGQELLTENDIQLIHEIQKMKKRFYYVCTKVDIIIDGEQRKTKKNFKEKETLNKIRNDCEEGLRKAGEPSPRVFLISRWEFHRYDFLELIKQMEKDQDVIKKDALAMFMPLLTKESLRQKEEALKEYLWNESFHPYRFGLSFIPGFFPTCNIDRLGKAMNHILKEFGLDEHSLNLLAVRVGKSVDDLKSAIQNCPTDGEISKEMVINVLMKSQDGIPGEVAIALESTALSVPIVGSLFGAANSFIRIYLILKNFMKNVMKDAENVLAKAAE